MKKGNDYEDGFAPVPRSTANRVFYAICTAEDMDMDKIDFTQAFIQGSWKHLPEGAMPEIYICPPKGVEEDADIIYQVLKPLYGIPSSARALHFTIDDFLQANGFVKSGFEESIWILQADTVFTSKIILTAHIDDILIGCSCREALDRFKAVVLD